MGLVELLEEALQMFDRHVLGLDAHGLDIVAQMGDVAQVGLHGIVGQITFQPQMSLEIMYMPVPVHAGYFFLGFSDSPSVMIHQTKSQRFSSISFKYLGFKSSGLASRFTLP